MVWIKVFLALVQLSRWVLTQIEKRKLLDQARIEAANEVLRKSNDIISGIDDTIHSVSNTPDDILRDPANRDSRVKPEGTPPDRLQNGVRD